VSVSRRDFLRGGTAALSLALTLRHGRALAATTAPQYRRIEDVWRNKWTWDRVAHGTHGTNCAGTCAFNVYIKNGVVWREEQQATYQPSGTDVPDYGPRGCNKGLRHAKYMYGKQRVLYPMRRAPGSKRGEGKWERISWQQATREIADRFLDVAVKYGPDSVSLGSGTQLAVKIASYSALARFATITGVTVPEFYSGVGDLPTGFYMTTGQTYLGDTMAAVYKSKCVLVWMANPAVTRIPDAHFFWEAKYNGTEVVTISPEFTPTAMHSSKWLNVKPGTDTALAMAMIHTIIAEKLYDAAYMREQTDLPFLVRLDNNEFLRAEDLNLVDLLAVRENVFYVWDAKTNKMVQAPGTGAAEAPVGRKRRKHDSIALNGLEPALEGTWRVKTRQGEVEVTTVFEILKRRAAEHAPDKTAGITGLNANAVRTVARTFAKAGSRAMIYTGFSACKWLHGDLMQRAMLLLCALTGSTGHEGGGVQMANGPKSRGITSFAFAGVGPAMRIISATTWDYDHGRMRELNEKTYGAKLAKEFDDHYQHSLKEDWFPQYGKAGWKMGIFAGENGANWRASGNRWRREAFEKLETIVAMVPDAGITMHHADYVLPIAHHYERADIMLQSRHPYVQVLDAAVRPLGEAVDDWEALRRLSAAIADRARERGIGAIRDDVDGRTFRRDFARTLELYTMNGKIRDTRDVVQFIINSTPGIPKMSFAELAAQGIVRVEDSKESVWHGGDSPFHNDIAQSVHEKRPYETLTGRQQYYIDHEWFLKFDEALPVYHAPLKLKDFPLQMTMGHARHGIHSMWRDDSFLVSLQRGEPDIYVNPDDAKQRGVKDGDLIEVFNTSGKFICQAHTSAAIMPGTVYMYHGWDPMMFKGQQNFAAVISTAGLIKPTSMAGDYGHLGYRILAFAPNQTYRDFTCDFKLHEQRAQFVAKTVPEAERFTR
jgi:DMSO reductase family type II enzyme molybdopterin subunit